MKRKSIVLGISLVHLLFSLFLVIWNLAKGGEYFSNASLGDRFLDLLSYIFFFPLGWLLILFSKSLGHLPKTLSDILAIVTLPLNSLLWGIFLYFLGVKLWNR
ncbi:hypothetical protein TUMEXPCC7403_10380 [Tumidithrix helvetica PCC 7403]|uniref:hypothetical protein n=1 Tax=Tumidithrix helvetica TaxID=3457545 RepID=UPI003C8B5221